MTQNGPYSGPPSQPWPAGGDEPEPYRKPAGPYQEPSDPWGEQHLAAPGDARPATDHAGAAPHPYAGSWGDEQPVDPAAGYGAAAVGASAPEWAPPPPPAVRRGPQRWIVALVVALGVLTCAGLGTTAWLLVREVGRDTAADDRPLSPSTVGPTVPTASAPAANPNAVPPSSTDARFVTKGQCVRNEGTSDVPQMTISPCASGAYEVLFRVNGRTTGEADAEAKCAKVPDYSKWYFYDSDLDSLDFVLCLKER